MLWIKYKKIYNKFLLLYSNYIILEDLNLIMSNIFERVSKIRQCHLRHKRDDIGYVIFVY